MARSMLYVAISLQKVLSIASYSTHASVLAVYVGFRVPRWWEMMAPDPVLSSGERERQQARSLEIACVGAILAL